MIDLSVISIPLIIIINTYCFLWIFLSTVYLTRKAEVGDPPLQDHFVSVILPARDEERVIHNIIEDLKRQTYKNLEVIVVAHNCQDKTYEKALEASESSEIPIKVYQLTTKDVGKGIGLQYGLEKSRGDLVVYFDSDSGVPPTYIGGLMEWIERGYDAVQGNIVAKNPHYNKLTFLQHLEFSIFPKIFCGGKHRLGLSSGIGGTGVMLTKESLDAIGDFRNVLVEDYDLFLRLTCHGFKVAYAEDCIVYDEKVPSWRGLLKQRARWIAGHLQVLRDYSPKEYLKILLKSPIDFLNLFSPICMLALFGSLILSLLRLFPMFTFLGTPFIFWVGITVFTNFLFSMVLIRQNFSLASALISPYVLYAFSLHWYVAFIKAFFVHGWSDTKTEHGFS